VVTLLVVNGHIRVLVWITWMVCQGPVTVPCVPV